MKNKILICTLAAAVVAGGLTATKIFAADNSAAMTTRGRILERVAERLNLTDDQKSQIKTILAGQRDKLQPQLAALHEARENLRTAIRAGNATETSVRAASAKVAAAESDLAVERMKIYGKIAPVLTDEQRQKIAVFEQRADEFVDNVIAQIGSGLGN